MASELSESVRNQIVILSKEGLSQRQIMARLQVSKGAVHGTLKRAAETGSVASKARSGRTKVTRISFYCKDAQVNFLFNTVFMTYRM